MAVYTTKLYCPFTCCTQNERAENPRGMDSKTSLKHHLLKCHREDLYKLKDLELESLGIFLCRQCDDHIAISDGYLKRHIKTKHVTTRREGNLQLATKTLYSPVQTATLNHWNSGLQWLANFKPTPPNFRQCHCSK